MMEFQVVLEEDPEVAGVTATVPALPEIVVDADTVDEALRLVREAIRFALEERAKDAGAKRWNATMAPRAWLATVEV